jgi:hypothetical protein
MAPRTCPVPGDFASAHRASPGSRPNGCASTSSGADVGWRLERQGLAAGPPSATSDGARSREAARRG